MKVLAVFLLFALASCQGQERVTTTEDLLDAQRELTIGHEFAEIFLTDNRQLLSEYLEIIERVVLDSFLDSYAEIRTLGDEITARMDDFEEPSFCKDGIRARWVLQVTRFGQKLSRCLRTTNNYFHQFNGILNNLHVESRTYSNVIPNTGVKILSDIDIFTGTDNIKNYINSQFREYFFRARDFHAEFEEFIGGISIELNALIATYTECYTQLPIEMNEQAEADWERIMLCYSD